MTIHTMEPERRTLHGHFSRDLPPALTIDSGDTVRFRTLEAGWGIEPPSAPGAPSKKFTPRIKDKDNGHALCGPVEVRGTQPGMTLEIQIDMVRSGAWGWSCGGGWPSELNKRLGVAEGDQQTLLWKLDPEALVGQDQHGHTIALRPFMGVMGMPPPEPGIHPTWPPRTWGGNLDCKELAPGSRLFLPIPVPGALFSVGDGHAAQGDGEVSGVAIECPMERVELTFHLRDDLPLSTPRAHTPAGWLTFGLHEDLNEATLMAVNAMLDLMQELHGLQRREALAMASLIVDLRITQIVNGTRGVHAVLPHGAIR